MSTGNYIDAVRDALDSGDLTRLKEVLAIGRQHLKDHGDVATLVSLLEVEISKIENHRN